VGYEQFVGSLNLRRRRKQHRLLKPVIWKAYQIGTLDRRDDHPGVYMGEERPAQFVDYRLKVSITRAAKRAVFKRSL
jgi:hypothetical protein